MLPAGISDGTSVSATATDPGGNTSEFSACRESTSGGPTSVSYNWHYQYDALSRLTSACSNWEAATSTCLGDGFDYAYDGAGNLLSFSRWSGTAVETVNFVYNSANQIICLDGDANGACEDAGDVPYSYDAYGNLTSDGMKTYTFDAENRLISVTEGVSTTTYTYNGDGDRISQTVDGVTTTYVNDTATPLTMLLAETTGTDTIYYLHGLDLVAQNDGVSSEYFAYDGLGSVRQMLDGAGNVLLAQAFDPYGNPGTGTDSTSFGFTGEQTDTNGLIFLRARYYNPRQGRFLQRDLWNGDGVQPISLNSGIYSNANPVNFTDPSGYFIQPNFCLQSVFSLGYFPISAGTAVQMCKDFYSMNSWKPYIDCSKRSQEGWVKRENVWDLFTDYICDTGPDSVTYYSGDKLTKELAASQLISEARSRFYPAGVDIPVTFSSLDRQVDFNLFEVFMATLELFEKNANDVSMLQFPDLNITHFLGSVDFAIYNLPSDRIGIYIHNTTDLSSGTHFPGRSAVEYNKTLEEILHDHPYLKEEPLSMVVNQYPVISILSARTREQTKGTTGGGNMDQIILWSEKKLTCTAQKLPWPVYLFFTDYGPWSDYQQYIR